MEEIETGKSRDFGEYIFIKANGRIHNENGPAMLYADGYTVWYINDKIHRENGPAIVEPYNNNNFKFCINNDWIE